MTFDSREHLRMQMESELSRFYDADAGPGSPMHLVLRHADDEAQECWYLEQRIVYLDRHFPEPIVVPRDRTTFTTDLTSVPQLFTWLVPRTGSHLAAAIVHDALTPPYSVPGSNDWDGPPVVTQLQADRVFRDAMGDLGTPLIRRWLVWSAVSIPTAWKESKVRGGLGYLGLLAIVVLGWFATLDLFDQGEWLPWMGAKAWYIELGLGAVMAVVIPLLLAVLWPKNLHKAGAITGVALAALLHVTVAVAAVSFAYQVAEHRWKAWSPPKRWLKILGTLLALGVAGLTYWMFRRYDS